MSTVFCCYTKDKLYSAHAGILKHSAEKFKINFKSYEYSKDEWSKIIALKLSFIKKVHKENKVKVLYIDADAIILSDISDYFNSITESLFYIYPCAAPAKPV